MSRMPTTARIPRRRGRRSARVGEALMTATYGPSSYPWVVEDAQARLRRMQEPRQPGANPASARVARVTALEQEEERCSDSGSSPAARRRNPNGTGPHL